MNQMLGEHLVILAPMIAGIIIGLLSGYYIWRHNNRGY
jgi:ABC-type dipeptide/oligopeptide/nickel transport system permease subunit